MKDFLVDRASQEKTNYLKDTSDQKVSALDYANADYADYSAKYGMEAAIQRANTQFNEANQKMAREKQAIAESFKNPLGLMGDMPIRALSGIVDIATSPAQLGAWVLGKADAFEYGVTAEDEANYTSGFRKNKAKASLANSLTLAQAAGDAAGINYYQEKLNQIQHTPEEEQALVDPRIAQVNSWKKAADQLQDYTNPFREYVDNSYTEGFHEDTGVGKAALNNLEAIPALFIVVVFLCKCLKGARKESKKGHPSK